MRKFLQACSLGWLALLGAGVSAETHYLRAAEKGYSAEKAYQLRRDWTVGKFQTLTPEGAYSYLHLAEQLPHATIYRAGPVAPLVRHLDAKVSALQVQWQGLRQTVDEVVLADDSPLQGVMVVHRGRVVYEQYPGMRPFDNHVWMSNAKPVASLLIAQLAEEGRIDVMQPVETYLPALRGTDWQGIRLLDVINMQSGLDIEENATARANPRSGIARFYKAEVGQADVDGQLRTHNEALFAVKQVREPGEAFEYSSINTQLLGLFIEAVTGQRLADVVAERIWMPAGMEGDGQLALTPQGNGIIHGLITSRLADMARFGMLYTPSWSRISTQRVVSAKVLNDIQAGGNPANYLKGVFGPHLQKQFGELPRANAQQWDAVFEDGDIYKAGMNGQGLYVSPSRDLVVAWFANGFSPLPMERVARAVALSRSPL